MKRRTFLTASATIAALFVSACGSESVTTTDPDHPEVAQGVDDPAPREEPLEQQFPDVLEADLTRDDGGQYTIAVTISSPYDTAERYADGWRVMTPDGDVLAEHELLHDHANEQPFTRSRGPFEIPDDVDEVVVEGRDQEFGYGGETVTIPVPR